MNQMRLFMVSQTETMNKKNFFPLGQSPIWAHQKAYYQLKEAKAWCHVPFLYTSNKRVAHWLSSIIAIIRKSHANQRVHIIELGAGHAMFSYFLLQSLKALNIDAKFTITDLVQSNLDYLQALPQWQGESVNWLKCDVIEDLHLLPDLDGPTFVIANYFFDSLPHDGYEFKDGAWHDVYLQCGPKTEGIDGYGDQSLVFESRPGSLDEAQTKLLARYEGIADQILIPSTVKSILTKLYEQSQPVYCFVNDKGFLSPEDMNYSDHYAYDCDGAMATMVNFDAIKYWLQTEFNGFFTVNRDGGTNSHITMLGLNTNNEQALICESALSSMSWSYQFSLLMAFKYQEKISFNDCCRYIKISNYDEAMLAEVSGFLTSAIKKDPELIVSLKPILDKVLKSAYWHPGRLFHIYALIDLLILCRQNKQALDFMSKYKHLVPSQYEIFRREGVIYYQMLDFDQSKNQFQKALKINSKCPHAKKYLELMQ